MQSSEVEEAYQEALRRSRELPRPDIVDDMIISFSIGAEPPAYILYRAVAHSGRRVQLASASEAGIHIIPYRETGSLVVFNYERKEPRVIHTVEAASLLGLRVYLVSPPMHPAYEEKVDSLGVDRITVEPPYPLLVMSLASLQWAPKMMGGREARLRAEIGELDTALEWVRGRISSVAPNTLDMILYTPSTAPGAYYHCMADPRCMKPIPLDYAAKMSRGSRGIAYLAGVDEHDYRDVMSTARVKGVKLEVIKIDTDPVTAGVYSVIAAAIITGVIL